MIPFELTTERLLLDQPGEADIDAITEYCQDPSFAEYLPFPVPYIRRDAEFFVNEYVPGGWARGDEVTWALRRRDDRGRAFMGVVGVRSGRGDVGFWLGAPFRGYGYMPEAVDAVLAWVREARFIDGAVKWFCVQGNIGSARVAQKCGFAYRGTSTLTGRDDTEVPSWTADWGGDGAGLPWPAMPQSAR